jgi:transcriptional regulator with XRE-family HTH domain
MPLTIPRSLRLRQGVFMTRLSELGRPSISPLHALGAAAPTAPPLINHYSPNGETSAPPVPTSIIAARLRWFRTERGLRLEDVAKRAGYTKGFLSKIEHGKASPPMTTLLRVAAALGVQADVLFAPDAGAAPDATVHTPAGQGVPIRDDGAGPGRTQMALAAQRHHKLMEPSVVTLEAGQASVARRLTGPGEEFIYVLEGEMDLNVGDEVFRLKPGDGLYFNATNPHSATAPTTSVRFVRVFCASPARRQRGNEGE